MKTKNAFMPLEAIPGADILAMPFGMFSPTTAVAPRLPHLDTYSEEKKLPKNKNKKHITSFWVYMHQPLSTGRSLTDEST